MRRIGELAAEVLAGVSSKRDRLEEGTSDRGQLGVITTTAITVRKQNELNLSAGRSTIGRIADLGTGELSGNKRGHLRPKSSDLTGRKRPGRTD